jgi:hypothetical protein
VAVEDLVQVGREDALLARFAGERVRDAGRLDELLGLAQVSVGARCDVFVGQQPCPHELLGDRRRAPLARAARVLGDGGDDRARVEATVVPEASVLGRRRGVDDELGHVCVGDDPALLPLEAGELDLAGPVVDDGGLVERQLFEDCGIGKVAG